MLHVYICEMRGAQSADSVSYSRARVLLRQLAVGSRNICADQYELVEGALSQPVNYLNVTIGPSVAFGDERSKVLLGTILERNYYHKTLGFDWKCDGLQIGTRIGKPAFITDFKANRPSVPKETPSPNDDGIFLQGGHYCVLTSTLL